MTPFDTIAAVSTPPGKGGVAVIRISGNDAVDTAERVFVTQSGKPLRECPSRMQIYGYIMDGAERVDDVLCTRFASPHSYTGEDTVEIACHGGALVTRTVLELILAAGARLAEPGEFTRRAFVGGKLTLTEAEAISDLLEATGREQLRLNSSTARNALRDRIASIRSGLTSLLSSAFERIDYPEEDLGDFTDGEMAAEIEKLYSETDRLLRTYRTGRAINEGISAALVGKPNVGKSSVYNILVGEEAAIVTDLPGTTRDLLERRVTLGRVTLRLFDTAGIRADENADTVERIGIGRSREKLEKCELLLALFDASMPLDGEDRFILEELSHAEGTKIALVNKCDLGMLIDTSELSGYGFSEIIEISARDGEATVSLIEEVLDRLFTDGEIKTGVDPIISSARQHAALLRARDSLALAGDALDMGFAQDAVATDLERALGAIAELSGVAVSEEVVADIFSKFCVGK